MSGRKGAVDLAANTATEIGTAVPAGKIAATTVIFCNRTGADITVRLAVVDGALGDLAVEDYIEYDATVKPGSPLIVSKIPMSAGETVVAEASAIGISVQRRAFEEGA